MLLKERTVATLEHHPFDRVPLEKLGVDNPLTDRRWTTKPYIQLIFAWGHIGRYISIASNPQSISLDHPRRADGALWSAIQAPRWMDCR